jgi:two-component system chemotaxis sensor kinase CheA
LISQLSADKNSDVLNRVLTWQLEPIAKPFERLGEQAKALARRLGKTDLNVAIDGNGVNLDPDTWSHFFSSLVHVIRNSIDHGIESPDERTACGKRPYGTLSFVASSGPHSLTLEIGDDGRGIDWDTIAKKAQDKHLPTATPSQMLDALLMDGVSTKSEVSEISGRGVGMSAFVQRVKDMGGALDVRSQRGVGTTWVISFPWNPALVPTSRARPSNFPSKRPSLMPGIANRRV